MREFLQKMVRNKLIMAVISIIFGIVLIAGKGSAVAAIIRVLGVLLLIGGVVYLITYLAGKVNKGNPSTLASAILFILVALIFIAAPHWLIDLFPILMGLVLIISSIFNISAALSAPVHTGLFTGSLVLSILSLILGFVAVLHPAAMANVLIAFIGVTYLINGVSDLIAISLMK